MGDMVARAARGSGASNCVPARVRAPSGRSPRLVARNSSCKQFGAMSSMRWLLVVTSWMLILLLVPVPTAADTRRLEGEPVASIATAGAVQAAGAALEASPGEEAMPPLQPSKLL